MDDEALLALYDRRRECSRSLNAALVGAASKQATLNAGKRLGLVQGGVFVFDNPQEATILSDACVYAVRDATGDNAPQRAARRGDYAAGSPEQEVLSAMSRARFSLFALGDRVPGVWIEAADVLTNQRYRIVDRGLSATPTPLFAARLVVYPEFAMTTGAGMPIAEKAVFERLADAIVEHGITLAALRAPEVSPQLQDEFFYATASHLLREGVLRRTRYIDPTNPEELAALAEDEGGVELGGFSPPQLPVRREGIKVGRNDPCPCGSGRKYKKCHGA